MQYESSNKTSWQELDKCQDSKIQAESRIKTNSLESTIKLRNNSKTSKECLVQHLKALKPITDKKPQYFDKKEMKGNTSNDKKTPMKNQLKKPVKQKVKEREQ